MILEERGERIDGDPAAQLDEAVRSALFQNSRYGIPTIGWAHEMAKLSLADAVSWYDRYYTPNNAIVIVAGDVTEDEVRRLAEATYGKVPRRFDPPPRERAREPEPLAARTVTLSDPQVTQPSMQRVYLAPSYVTGEPGEGEALDLLAEILGGGTTSRLYRDLVVDQAIAASAGTFYQSSTLGEAMFGFYGVPRGDATIDQLEAAIDAEIAKVVASGVTEAELASAKRRVLAATVYAEDSASALARSARHRARHRLDAGRGAGLAGGDRCGDARSGRGRGAQVSRHQAIGHRLSRRRSVAQPILTRSIAEK